ncbi:MAG: T9SS type A sorting domain-containing protein [Flavobacteriia bacterium]|jgi:hypothetical protein
MKTKNILLTIFASITFSAGLFGQNQTDMANISEENAFEQSTPKVHLQMIAFVNQTNSTVTFANIEGSGPIQIYNQSGALTETLENNYPFVALKSGLYTAVVKQANGEIQMERIIVR